MWAALLRADRVGRYPDDGATRHLAALMACERVEPVVPDPVGRVVPVVDGPVRPGLDQG
jgi:hypothetical protein